MRVQSMRLILIADRPDWRRNWDEILPVLLQHEVEPFLVTPGAVGSLHRQWAQHGCGSFALGCRRAEDYPAGAARLARLVRSREIDVIHGVEPIPALIGGVAGRLTGRGLRVFHRQHTDFGDDLKRSRLSRLAARVNDVTLACCWAAGAAANELDRTPWDRIRVAHNGGNRMREVSEDEIVETRVDLGIPRGAIVVSAVTRLRPEKGLTSLISTHPWLARDLAPAEVHLVIAGEGPEEAALRDRADEVAPGRVHFVGYQGDVAPWFAIADAVAMPSSREGSAVAGAEAMASARPLVASAVGGLVELVEDGVTGVLVEQGNVEALAAGLSRVLSDSERARAMGAAARERFETRFTNGAMVTGWLECYRELSNHW